MSTFPGRIPELPGIMVDLLESDDNLNAFFISHDHADHKRGINDPEFQKFMTLKARRRRIYVSPLTAQMMLNRVELTALHDVITPLELERPHQINIRTRRLTRQLPTNTCPVLQPPGATDTEMDEYTLFVTLTPAEHIMGSVMFLFEKTTEPKVIDPIYRCLYTGDFRLTINEIKAKKCLKDHSRGDGSCPKKFNSVYFDSTWCTPRNLWSIPQREDVLEELGPIVEHHLAAKTENLVCLYTNYNIGYENLLKWLANISGSRIHVTEKRMMLYRGFPGMEDVLTTNPDCRIHFCQEGPPQPYRSCANVRRGFKTTVLRLKASYMWFIKEHRANPEMSTCVRNLRLPNEYNLCWSTHPSLEEVLGLLDYLDPFKAFPNVIDEKTSETEILDTLRRRSILSKSWHPTHELDKFEPPQPQLQKVFSKKPSPKKAALESSARTNTSSDSDEDSPDESLEERLRKKGKLASNPKPRKAISLDNLHPD